MAVAVVMEFNGATLAQYDQIIDLMGLNPRGAGPPGSLFHWVAETPGGMLVTDVWESKEAYERFAAEKIGPFSGKVGLPSPPTTTFHELHNYLTSGQSG